MIKVDLKGLDSAKSALKERQREVKNATKRALINTALAVRDAEQEHMRKVFDKPTPWTIGAIRVKALDDMTVVVGVVDPDGFYKRADYYLGTQIGGSGRRREKAMEKALQHYRLMPDDWRAVPGEGAKLDAFGNMGPGQIRQILSFFGAAERWAGSTQNMTQAKKEKLRRGTKTKRGFEYFVVSPGATRSWKRGTYESRGRHKMQPGIYMRIETGFGDAIKPILIFVKGAAYRSRLNMKRVAEETVARVWRHKFDAALTKAGLL